MMELDQFRKIYSDYRLAEARTKAMKWSSWDNSCQRFNIQPPQQKTELHTRKVDLVPRIPEVVRTVSSRTPLTKGLTSKLAGVDNRDQNEKFLTYGDLFNFEAIPSDLTDMIKRALEPLKIQIFIEGKTSIEKAQRTDGFTTSIAIYTLVKNIIATLITIRDGVTVDDRKRLRDGTNSLNTLTKEGMNAQTVPENVATVVKAVAGVVELDLNEKLQTPMEDDSTMEVGAEPDKEAPEAPVAPSAPDVDLTQNRTDTAADLHDQNVLNAANSTKASQALIPANQRDIGSIEKVEKGDITEALMAIQELLRELTASSSQTETQSEGDVSQAVEGQRVNPVDGKVLASESNVLARKNEGENAIEALRKALTEARFKPDDPKSKTSWRPPENWKYDEATKTWSFTAIPSPGSVPIVPGTSAAAVAPGVPDPTTARAPGGGSPGSDAMGTVVQQGDNFPTFQAINPSAGIGMFSSMLTPSRNALAVPQAPRTNVLPIATPSGNALAVPQAQAQPQGVISPTLLSADDKLKQIRFAPNFTYASLMSSDNNAIRTSVMVVGGDVIINTSIFFVTSVEDRVEIMKAVRQYLLVKGEVAYNDLSGQPILFLKKRGVTGFALSGTAGSRTKLLTEQLKSALQQPIPMQITADTAAVGPPAPLPVATPATVQNGGVDAGEEGTQEGSGKPRGIKRKLSSSSSNLHDSADKSVKPRKKRLDILSGSGFIPVVFGGDNIQTTDKNLSDFKDEVIYDMKILRSPLPRHMDEVLDLITRGEFTNLKQKYHFDQIFHLAVMVTTMKGDLLIEKNAHGVNIARYKPYPADDMSVVSRSFGKPDFTVGSLILNTQKALGDKFFSYSAFGNNCQNFIFNLLRSNGLMTLDYANFVSQDMTELLKDLNVSNPHAVPVINTITGALGMKQRYDDYIENNPNPSIE